MINLIVKFVTLYFYCIKNHSIKSSLIYFNLYLTHSSVILIWYNLSDSLYKVLYTSTYTNDIPISRYVMYNLFSLLLLGNNEYWNNAHVRVQTIFSISESRNIHPCLCCHYRNITGFAAKDLNLFQAQLNFETLIFPGKVPATLSGELGPGCRTAPNEFFLIIKIPVAPGGQN